MPSYSAFLPSTVSSKSSISQKLSLITWGYRLPHTQPLSHGRMRFSFFLQAHVVKNCNIFLRISLIICSNSTWLMGIKVDFWEDMPDIWIKRYFFLKLLKNVLVAQASFNLLVYHERSCLLLFKYRLVRIKFEFQCVSELNYSKDFKVVISGGIWVPPLLKTLLECLSWNCLQDCV